MSASNLHYVALQEAVVDRLTSGHTDLPPAPVPANGQAVPIVSEQLGDLESRITNSLAKLGLVVVVLTPKANLLDPDVPGLDQMAPILVQVQENGLVNKGNSGTKISALTMVVFVMKRLHFWPHDLYEGSPESMYTKLEKTPFVLINDFPQTVYNVAAWTPLNLDLPLKNPPAPR